MQGGKEAGKKEKGTCASPNLSLNLSVIYVYTYNSFVILRQLPTIREEGRLQLFESAFLLQKPGMRREVDRVVQFLEEMQSSEGPDPGQHNIDPVPGAIVPRRDDDVVLRHSLQLVPCLHPGSTSFKSTSNQDKDTQFP